MKNERPVCEMCGEEMKPSRIDYFCWDIQYKCSACGKTAWRHNDGRRSEGFQFLLGDLCEAIKAMNRPIERQQPDPGVCVTEKLRRKDMILSYK